MQQRDQAFHLHKIISNKSPRNSHYEIKIAMKTFYHNKKTPAAQPMVGESLTNRPCIFQSAGNLIPGEAAEALSDHFAAIPPGHHPLPRLPASPLNCSNCQPLPGASEVVRNPRQESHHHLRPAHVTHQEVRSRACHVSYLHCKHLIAEIYVLITMEDRNRKNSKPRLFW